MHTLWAPELYQNEPFDNNRDCWVYQTFQSLKCGWFSPYSPSLLLASITLFKRFTVTLSISKTNARYIQLMITIRGWILITRSLTRKVCHLVNKLLVIYPIDRNYCIVVKNNFLYRGYWYKSNPNSIRMQNSLYRYYINKGYYLHFRSSSNANISSSD